MSDKFTSEVCFKQRNHYVNCLIWMSEILIKHFVLNPSKLKFLTPEQLHDFAHRTDCLILDLD